MACMEAPTQGSDEREFTAYQPVLMARELVGYEPFAVLLADDVIDSRVPALKQLFIREAAGLLGEVPKLLRGEAL